MKYRSTQLLAAKSITTAGTEVLDLNVTDIVSRLTVIVRLTNASWTPTGHPAVSVVQLELVDGKNVLHSLRGSYSSAVAFYGTGTQPFMYANYTDNGQAVATIPIFFGRHLWDPVFALDPKKFGNLQLKIQHNYALGGAAPDAATVEVWADLFDEFQPSPVGYLSCQSLWSKTLVASTTDYVEIPTDSPIRLLCPAAFSNAEEPDINIDKFKLMENGDKSILLETDTLNHLQQIETLFPEWVEWFEGRTLANTDITFYCAPQKDLMVIVTPSQDSDGYINPIWSGGGIRKINENATVTIMGNNRGRCPFGVIPIPLGILEEPDSWWDVTKSKAPRIKMVTGAGSVAALYELLVQQARAY